MKAGGWRLEACRPSVRPIGDPASWVAEGPRAGTKSAASQKVEAATLGSLAGSLLVVGDAWHLFQRSSQFYKQALTGPERLDFGKLLT